MMPPKGKGIHDQSWGPADESATLRSTALRPRQPRLRGLESDVGRVRVHDPVTDRPILYMLCGLPFAGKSTLARALAARLGISRVELDAINTERGLGLDGAPISPEEWTATYAEVYRRIAGHLCARTSAIFDAVNFTHEQRDEVRALAEGCGAGLRLIYLAVPPERAIARWQRNRLTGERHDVPDDNFALVHDGFEPPAADEDALIYDESQPLDDWLAAHFPI